MKLIKLVLALVVSLTLVGCQTEEDKAIESIRSALSDINKGVEKGVSYTEYNDSISRLGATMLIAKSKIDMEKRSKEVMPLVLAGLDYTVVQLLWVEYLMTDTFRQNDIVVVRGDLLPDGADKIKLREESRATAKKVFNKDNDTEFQLLDRYILPKRTAFSLYWIHAELLVKTKIK
jgi:hypothetical protein